MKTKKQGAQKAPAKKDGRRALAVGTGSISAVASAMTALLEAVGAMHATMCYPAVFAHDHLKHDGEKIATAQRAIEKLRKK